MAQFLRCHKLDSYNLSRHYLSLRARCKPQGEYTKSPGSFSTSPLSGSDSALGCALCRISACWTALSVLGLLRNWDVLGSQVEHVGVLGVADCNGGLGGVGEVSVDLVLEVNWLK